MYFWSLLSITHILILSLFKILCGYKQQNFSNSLKYYVGISVDVYYTENFITTEVYKY